MQGRLAPEGADEKRALAEAGADLEQVLELDDLARGETLFAASGISGGALLRAPWESAGATHTESILVTAGTVRRVVEYAVEDRTPGATDHG
jgi:fructose-1,6-bisphosphatase/sedoheptulose 1,7-bisphosphatase-like protein